jgi:hypothetical protein
MMRIGPAFPIHPGQWPWTAFFLRYPAIRCRAAGRFVVPNDHRSALRSSDRGRSPALHAALLLTLLLVLPGSPAAAQPQATPPPLANGASTDWASLAELAQKRDASPAERSYLFPTDPESPPLALDPYLHLLAARDRQTARDRDGARAEIAAAIELDPDLLEAHLFGVRLDLHHSPAVASEHLEAAVRIFRQRFALQSTALAALGWGFLVFILAWLTLLAMAYASHRAAPVHHLITERLRLQIEPRLAPPLAIVLILLPLAWGAGLLVTALLVLLFSGARRSRGERAVLAGGIAMVLLCGFLPLLPAGLLRPASFQDPAQLLDFADHVPLTPGMGDRLDAIAESGTDLALLVHGQALLPGNPAGARVRLERYVGRHGEDPRAFLALGNLEYVAGDARAAVHRYRQSIALDSTRIEPHVNLALAYSALMQFEMANAELAIASRIDHQAVGLDPGAGSGAQPQPVRLEPSELWALHQSTAGGATESRALPGFMRPLLPFGGGPRWPIALVLLAAAWPLSRLLAQRLNPFPCSVCGRSVCRRCVTRRRGLSLCSHCQRAIGEVPAEQVVRQLVAIERQRMKSHHQLRRLGWNALCPGQGLLLASRPRSAALLLAMLALVATGFLTRNHPIVPLPTVPAGGLGPLPDPTAALALVAAWLATAAISNAVRPDLAKAVRGRIVPLAAGPAVLRAGERGPGRSGRAFTGTDG